jgi:TolA-binding protein
MTRLREHIEAPVDDARVERQWSALSAAGLPRAEGRSPRLVWVLAGALAMAAIGGLALQLQREDMPVPVPVPAPQARKAPELPTGAVLESADAEVAVQLSDGSHVALAPRAQMRVRSNKPKTVELELASGQARFDVRHDTDRRFAIRIADVEVRVLGTRFDLERREQSDGTFVQVSVSEGVVEVQVTRDGAPELTRIHASEAWSTLIARVPEPEPALEPEPEPDTVAAPRPRKANRAPEADPAADLFTQATLARRAGRMRDAADSYLELLDRYPGDARGALSAFELGRLRMDALGDPKGAIEALERALKAGASASFREDALARIVVASDALGRTQQCLRARQRYAEQYPSGVHQAALAQRCK